MSEEEKRLMEEDEINLLELWKTIWNGRYWIVLWVFIALLLAIGYLWYAQKEYRASVYLLPPSESDIAQLNQLYLLEQSKQLLTPENVYRKLLLYLKARSLKRKIFDRYDVAELFEVEPEDTDYFFARHFVERINVEEVEKKDSENRKKGAVEISMMFPSQDKVAEMVNEYVKSCLNEVKHLLVEDILVKRDNKIELVGRNIAIKRKLISLKKQDKTLMLKEALVIANELGITHPMDTNTLKPHPRKDLGSLQTPLYYQGSIALSKEIDNINKRVNDDAYINDLRRLQEQLKNLKSIKIDKSLIKAANVDSWAYNPLNPEKPKKLMILLLSVMLGGILGVFFVFIKNAMRSELEHEKNYK